MSVRWGPLPCRTVPRARRINSDIEQLLEAFAERSPKRNVASLAVTEREWQQVIEWLSTKNVWTHPDTVNKEEIEQVLRRSMERELLLMPTE